MRKGTKHTEETKAKIAAAKVGKTFTPEHSAAISAALKGQKKTAAHRRAISEGIKAARANKVVVGIDPAAFGSDMTVTSA
jgi:NAD(P)H-dependent FMN reductase